MFTKIAVAVAIIFGTASASFAAPKHTNQGPSVSSTSQPLYFKYATGAEWWH